MTLGRAFAVACTLLVAPSALALDRPTSTPPLRVEDVLASVERALPLLKAAEQERAVAVADVSSAEGGFDVSWKTRGTVTPVGYYESVRVESMLEKPTAVWGASTFAGWRLGTGAFPTYDAKQQTLEYGEIRAGLNVPLWRNGPIDRRRATLARAELGVELAGLSIAEQRIQLRRTAAHRYWAWVASGRRLRIAEALLRIVEGRDSGLAERVAHGDLPEIERTDNARAIEQRKAQVALAQRGLEQAAIELGLYFRDDAGAPSAPSPTRLPDDFPELAADASDGPVADVALAQARRPEGRRFQLQLRQQEIELAWAKNQLAPGIDVQLAASQDLGRSLAGRSDLSVPVLEATLLVDVPLQTRLMAGRVEASRALAARALAQQAFARDRIDADVRDAHSAIRRARERVTATRREVTLAVALETAERTRFDQGDSHLLIVNLREQQTAEAQLREVDALLDYHRAVADLRAARGE